MLNITDERDAKKAVIEQLTDLDSTTTTLHDACLASDLLTVAGGRIARMCEMLDPEYDGCGMCGDAERVHAAIGIARRLLYPIVERLADRDEIH